MLYSFIIANVTNEILLASITKNGMLYSMTHNNDTQTFQLSRILRETHAFDIFSHAKAKK
jgi:hypothetical protein